MAPGETRSLYSFNLTAAFYSGTAITQTVTWSSSDTSVATVNSSTGNVTGVSPGWTVIYASRLVGGTTYSASYDVYVTEIANGTYFLKSKDSSRYVDIEGQNMANGTNILQWDFHSDGSQRWVFTHLGDGYYSIKSANSTSNYYLGVLNDGTATDTQVVLRTGSLTDGMKWKVSVTTSGAYKITPKTGEPNDRVLAVGWYVFNVNGIDIKQRDYVDDDNYKDEWILSKPESSEYTIFWGIKSPTKSFSIQCVGTLATGTTWYPLIQASATAWNSSGAGTNISTTTSSSSYSCEVDSYKDGWFGLTTATPDSNGNIISATVKINSRKCSTDANSRKSTITHEIGHLLGLDDNPPVLNANDSLMNHSRDRTTVYAPQPYDIMNVKYIYSLN